MEYKDLIKAKRKTYDLLFELFNRWKEYEVKNSIIYQYKKAQLNKIKAQLEEIEQ